MALEILDDRQRRLKRLIMPHNRAVRLQIQLERKDLDGHPSGEALVTQSLDGGEPSDPQTVTLSQEDEAWVGPFLVAQGAKGASRLKVKVTLPSTKRSYTKELPLVSAASALLSRVGLALFFVGATFLTLVVYFNFGGWSTIPGATLLWPLFMALRELFSRVLGEKNPLAALPAQLEKLSSSVAGNVLLGFGAMSLAVWSGSSYLVVRNASPLPFRGEGQGSDGVIEIPGGKSASMQRKVAQGLVWRGNGHSAEQAGLTTGSGWRLTGLPSFFTPWKAARLECARPEVPEKALTALLPKESPLGGAGDWQLCLSDCGAKDDQCGPAWHSVAEKNGPTVEHLHDSLLSLRDDTCPLGSIHKTWGQDRAVSGTTTCVRVTASPNALAKLELRGGGRVVARVSDAGEGPQVRLCAVGEQDAPTLGLGTSECALTGYDAVTLEEVVAWDAPDGAKISGFAPKSQLYVSPSNGTSLATTVESSSPPTGQPLCFPIETEAPFRLVLGEPNKAVKRLDLPLRFTRQLTVAQRKPAKEVQIGGVTPLSCVDAAHSDVVMSLVQLETKRASEPEWYLFSREDLGLSFSAKAKACGLGELKSDATGSPRSPDPRCSGLSSAVAAFRRGDCKVRIDEEGRIVDSTCPELKRNPNTGAFRTVDKKLGGCSSM